MPGHPGDPRNPFGDPRDEGLDPLTSIEGFGAEDPADAPPPASQPTPVRAQDMDTSELSFGAAFDNLAGVARESAAAQRTIPEGAMSALEVSGESPNGHVQVTIKDAEIHSLTVSQQWLDGTHARELEREFTAVLNDTLRRYNEAVMQGLQEVTPQMSEVTRMIDAVRAQVRGAFDTEMTRIGNESRRP